MLKIHKPTHKLFLVSITSILSISVLLGFSALTYTPELSHAETVTYKKTIDNITYMQEMNPEICKHSQENETKQLIDSRDSKTYWVTKLKDQNCWMTQNLALDLSTTKKLTNDLSDVSVSGYTPQTNTQQNTITQLPSASNRMFSYNPGEYVYTTPLEQNSCGRKDITQLEGCPNWTLPTGGAANGQYNILASELVASTTNNIENIKLAPYYFVYSGSVYDFSLYDIGAQGCYWSATVDTSNSSYGLYIHTSINPSERNRARYNGYSIRCVARMEADNNVEVMVTPTISLDVADEVMIEKTETNPSAAELDVKVSSNQPYTVAISSNDPVMRSSATSVTIPAKSGLLNTTENGWGIKLKENSEFTAVTNDLQTFYTTSGAEIKTISFTIGISTAPDTPNGEYSTNIIITATQN